MHIVEEIARNRSETSNRHCVVICGIIGRIVSANCNAYLVQSVVLDIWKGFQEKAREIVPQTEKVTLKLFVFESAWLLSVVQCILD